MDEELLRGLHNSFVQDFGQDNIPDFNTFASSLSSIEGRQAFHSALQRDFGDEAGDFANFNIRFFPTDPGGQSVPQFSPITDEQQRLQQVTQARQAEPVIPDQPQVLALSPDQQSGDEGIIQLEIATEFQEPTLVEQADQALGQSEEENLAQLDQLIDESIRQDEATPPTDITEARARFDREQSQRSQRQTALDKQQQFNALPLDDPRREEFRLDPSEARLVTGQVTGVTAQEFEDIRPELSLRETISDAAEQAVFGIGQGFLFGKVSQNNLGAQSTAGDIANVVGELTGSFLPIGATIQGVHRFLRESGFVARRVPALQRILGSNRISDVVARNALEALPFDVADAAIRNTDENGNVDIEGAFLSFAGNIAIGAGIGTLLDRYIVANGTADVLNAIRSANNEDDALQNLGSLIDPDNFPAQQTGGLFGARDADLPEEITGQRILRPEEPQALVTREGQPEAPRVTAEARAEQPETTVTPRQEPSQAASTSEPTSRPAEAQKRSSPESTATNRAEVTGKAYSEKKTVSQEQIEANQAAETFDRIKIDPDAASTSPFKFSWVADLPVKSRSFVRRFFTKEGDMPTSAFNRRADMTARTQAILKDVEFTARRIRKTFRDVYGNKEPTTAELEGLSRALEGEPGAISKVPLQFKPIIQDMRAQIDGLSYRLVDEGIVQGDIVAKINDNIGFYVTRSYKKYVDNDALRRYLDTDEGIQVRNKAYAYIKSLDNTYTDRDIKEIIAGVLDNGNSIDDIRAGKLSSRDISNLKKRDEDIAPEFRALMGEFRDPLFNYARTITKMANLIERTKFLEDVKNLGLREGWLFESRAAAGKDIEKVRVIGKDIDRPVETEGRTDINPLDGLLARPEIAEIFEEFQFASATATPTWLRTYMRIVAGTRFGKTVLNPMTHARNFFGNIGFAVGNGHFEFLNPANLKRAFDVTFPRGRVEFEEKLKRYIKLGIIDDSAVGGEMREIIREASKSEDVFDTFINRSYRDLLGRSLKGVTNLYQASDNVWKILGFESELKSYRKAFPDKPIAELEKEASLRIRDTYPTYSLVPEGVKVLRRVPFVGNFTAFPAEVIRTTKNTIKVASEELKEPATRSIGAKRAAGLMTAVLIGGYGAEWAGKAILNISDQEDLDRRRYMPEWDRNGQIIYLSNDQYINVSYNDPRGYILDPLNTIIEGVLNYNDRKIDDALFDASKRLLEPFSGIDITTGAILEIASNKKESGAPVYNPELDAAEKTFLVLEHFGKTIEPGITRFSRRVTTGQTDSYKDLSRIEEVAAAASGIRLTKQDFDSGVPFKIRDYRERLQNAASIYTRELFSRNPDKDINQALNDAVAQTKDAFREFEKDYDAGIRNGVNPNRILGELKIKGLLRRFLAYRTVADNEQELDLLIRDLLMANGKNTVQRSEAVKNLSNEVRGNR